MLANTPDTLISDEEAKRMVGWISSPDYGPNPRFGKPCSILEAINDKAPNICQYKHGACRECPQRFYDTPESPLN